MAVERPVLRYFGGKWMLAPWIIEHLPPHRIYLEPFGGGASVLLRKPRVYAEVYNDLDVEVVNLFRVMRDQDTAGAPLPGAADRLKELLHLTPFAREELDLARTFTAEPIERARRLVVRSFFGHGPDSYRMDSLSGFRGNAHSAGRVPQADWRNYPASLEATVERLRGVKIENRPAAELLREMTEADALAYVDPPYVWETRAKFRGAGRVPSSGYSYELDRAGHEELLQAILGCAGMVVVSGYETPLYDDALRGWEKITRDAYADGMSERTEALWINPSAWASLAKAVQPVMF